LSTNIGTTYSTNRRLPHTTSVRSAPVHSHLGYLAAVETVFSLQRFVVQRNTQCLGLSSQTYLPFNHTLLGLDSCPLLDLFFAFLDLTPGSQDHISCIQVGHEFFPIDGLLSFLLEPLKSLLVHQFLDVLEHDGQLVGQSIPFDL